MVIMNGLETFYKTLLDIGGWIFKIGALSLFVYSANYLINRLFSGGNKDNVVYIYEYKNAPYNTIERDDEYFDEYFNEDDDDDESSNVVYLSSKRKHI